MSELSDLQKKILFRCNHRGMKEVDLLLGKFANENIVILTHEEIVALEELLNENDPDLYNWITGKILPPAYYNHSLMTKLKQYTFSEND